jgi:hypothetical protein
MLVVAAGEVWRPASYCQTPRNRRGHTPHPLQLALLVGQSFENLIPNLLTDCGERRMGTACWYRYFDDPYRAAGQVGLGWGLMSQSAARLKPPA